ncbi:kinase-like domain-containing protein [Apiospora aurea]|uniref:Kinase-like domain-containing protein n=1 Tax=Apiospora aurea TaxID=335848 RepID=A0ABR1QKI9_9PEZI
MVDEIRDEITSLKRFRGSAHIVQMVSFRDRDADETSSDGTLPGPYIVLDYLENGTFQDFLERVVKAKARPPNRVLWSILLCFIRACVGLTWPSRGVQGQRERLEETSAVRGPTAAIAHNDLHMKNGKSSPLPLRQRPYVSIMFGSLQPDVEEHSLVPLCKIIDFGAAQSTELYPTAGVAPSIWQGHPSNTESLARYFSLLVPLGQQMLLRLIVGTTILPPKTTAVMSNGVETNAAPLWARGEYQRYPWLDERLRVIVGSLMTPDYRYRPTLESLLRGTTQVLSGLSSRSFPQAMQQNETTRAVRAFVQRFLLDAQDD